MTRWKRVLLWIAGGLAGVVLLAVIAALIVVQTAWFRDYVRTKIITSAEDATGGKVDIKSFSFDWTHLHARITSFVLHGTEPPNVAPLFSAQTIDVNLKLLSSLRNFVELEYLGVDQPAVNLIVYPDGHTNVPSPKVQPSASNTTALEDIVNLAIRKFDIRNGAIQFGERKSNFNAHGENLRAQLSYNIVNATYDGQVSMAPLHVSQNGRPPLDLNIAVPLHLERDKIQISSARIGTPQSQILVSGEMDHLLQPHESAHVNATISLAEVKQVLGTLPITIPPHGPGVLNADADVSMDRDNIQVSSARISLGHSTIEASGKLKDTAGNGALQFKASLVLDELGRLYQNAFNPRGVVALNGNARLKGANNDYQLDGNIDAKNLSFTTSGTHIEGVNLSSTIDANKDAIEMKGLRLAAFGGSFNGNAGVEKLERFHVDGRLANFDIKQLAGMFAQENVGYDGVISGPLTASGELKTPSHLRANVHLAIAPGNNGVPVSGQINADYNGAADSIDLAQSYIALPNTRLDLSGSVGRQLQIHLVSHNLNDFLPIAKMPIALQQGGSATFTGEVTGKLSAPQLTGHLAVLSFEAQQRPFDSLVADLNASSSGASIQNAALTRGSLQAHVTATVGLHNWSAPPTAPLTANATIANADLADIMAVAGQDAKDFSGTLNATAQIGGTIGDPTGSANLTVANLVAYQEHFDQLAGQVNFSDRLITIPDMHLTSGPNRISLSAAYQHAPDSLETGQLHATLASNSMELAQFETTKKGTAQLTGTLQLNADVRANVNQVNNETEFMLTNVNANASAHGLKYEGTNYGDFTGTAQTSGNLVSYNVNSDFAGSTIHAVGETRLVREYPTTANLDINNLRIERVLAVANRKDIAATGVLSTTAKLSGTLNDPHANADIHLTNATYYEHFDLIQGHLDYSKQAIDIPSLEVTSGAAHAQLSANFVPTPPGQFDAGHLTFKLDTNQIQLAQFKTLQDARPGMGGTVQVNAQGAATIQNAAGKPPVLFSRLDANASATGLSMNKKPYGDLKFTANTSGSDLVFNVDSNFAGSKIHGEGRAALTADYPINATLNFSNLHYANVRDWIGANATLQDADLDVLIDGTAKVSGPLTKVDDLKGSMQLPTLEVSAKERGALVTTQRHVVLKNQGPIVASLDRSTIRVDSAHLTGRDTDISVTGVATLQPKQDLNLTINGKTNLTFLQDFDRDMYSSGVIILQASVRGTLTDPAINGRAELQKASINMINSPNGISNANGVIVFNGKTATIQSLTGESGGGKVTASGTATYGNGTLAFQLAANASQVRVRYPEGASTVADANVKLTGNADNSTLSGTITIRRISFNPRSDFGSMLSSAATPVQTPAAPSPLLDNMHLQIQIQTSPDVAFQTSLAQNIQFVANLRVRGTASTPGVLGRINITQGTLIFFGTKYTLDQGIISFYDPLRIEPVLDINLETHVQGVDVILSVTGPIDNMQLTHRSDPPLPFNELISLLATGSTPTSDPVLAAHAAPAAPQSVQQMGESAVLGQVVANPVASRLQRVFGVSELKIAPAFVTGTELPEARLTLEQQVTSNLTFTYITDLTNSNEQVVRAEWALNPTWSAVATRDENGIFAIDFYYKRRIH